MMRSRLGLHTAAITATLLLCEAVPARAQTAPSLGAAQTFGVLSGTASVTNTGPTVINGDLGTSGVAGITGFPPGTRTGGTHNADAVAGQAQLDAITAPTSAFNNIQGQTCTDSAGATIFGVTTLLAGVHCYTSTVLVNGPLTLDAQNNPNAVFIMKLGSDLTVASGAVVQLANGAQPCNVFWTVRDATVGTGSTFIGTLLASRDISVLTNANSSGRIISGRAVTLDSNTVTPSSCAFGGGTGQCPPDNPRLPTISTISNQVIPVAPGGGTASVGFTIGGSVITDALLVSAFSSDLTLVPASSLVITRGVGGARVLSIRGADGRSGVVTITVRVTDPTVSSCVASTSTTFQLSIGTAVPTLPEWAFLTLAVLLGGAGFMALRRREREDGTAG